jgi:predicted small secreted protein
MRSTTISLTFTLCAAALLLASCGEGEGRGHDIPSFCKATCGCPFQDSSSCEGYDEEQAIQRCKDGLTSQRKDAEANGCEAEFDTVLACVLKDEQTNCYGALFPFGECGAEGAALRECIPG